MLGTFPDDYAQIITAHAALVAYEHTLLPRNHAHACLHKIRAFCSAVAPSIGVVNGYDRWVKGSGSRALMLLKVCSVIS